MNNNGNDGSGNQDGSSSFSFYQERRSSYNKKAVSASSNSSGASSNNSKELNFPAKLHVILSNPEYHDVISWLPHGRSFRILQLQAFEERILPKYFRHGRYPSFTRQLNGWGFRRITEGPEYNSHYHELFICGKPEMVDQMRRLTSKDMAKRKSSEQSSTAPPDFHSMPPVQLKYGLR